jgi:hypothetical protein
MYLLTVDNDYGDSITRDQFASYLGEYYEPEQCNIKKLGTLDPQCHAANIADVNFVSIAFRERFISAKERPMIPRIVQTQREGRNQYYTIDTSKSSTSCDFWSQAVKKTFFSNDHQKSSSTSSKLPFLIVNASVEIMGSKGFLPLDFTPLYYGKKSRSTANSFSRARRDKLI